MFELFLLATATLLVSYFYIRLRYWRFTQYICGLLTPPMVLLPSHDFAEQISKPTKLFPLSVPKSPTWTHMVPLIGSTSILDIIQGSRLNTCGTSYPFFLPLLLEKMETFWNRLDQLIVSGEEFSLETLISNLTFDVIGAAVLAVDLHAQHIDPSKQGEIIRLFRQLLAKRIDILIKNIIQHKYAELKEEVDGNRRQSIVALGLQESEALTPQLVSETSDQVRSFLFAGHDTNTSALQWAFYELSRTPRALKAVRDELDDGDSLLLRMHYINAVIKETLRLHPPAGTVRMTEPGTGFTIRAATGEEYCLDGLIMYSCQSIIQRDPNVYGDTADDWVPERWLDEKAKSIPPSAWRPFERGPRACIGSELANLESRVIIAIVARNYDFIKTGLGESDLDEKGLPMLNEKGQYKSKSELYNPVDGTTMKVT
ncbi:cytochrome P450 [Daldinia loculata]|nr:cytochrome P450 [Daldinia loculata]